MLEKANYCHEINYFLGGLKKLFCKLTSIIICVCVCVCIYKGPQYKGRRENTSFASSSEACIRSMAHSLGDAVSRSPLGEPWLHM